MLDVDIESPPVRLSDTGCFTALAPLTAGAGVIPFAVNAPLFSDGADKGRWIVPAGPASADSAGMLDFPPGTVLLKHFEVDGSPVETRVMIRANFDWVFHTYIWEDGEGVLNADGPVLDLGFDWEVPTPVACRFCHGATARALGPEIGQLQKDVCYDGGDDRPQLEALVEWGVLAPDTPAVPVLVDPSLSNATLEDRARSYLHSNCASCHRPGGWTPPTMDMDLRYATALGDARLCEVPIQFMGELGNTDLRLDPGNPWNSHLYIRMDGGGLGKMPPFGVHIDPDGLSLIGAWIHSMDGCD